VDRLPLGGTSVFQVASHEDTVPLEELYERLPDRPEILTGSTRSPALIRAGPFTGERPVRADRDRHYFSLEASGPQLPLVDPQRGHKVYGVGKISTSSRVRHSTRRSRPSLTSRGSTQTERCCRRSTRLIFVNLVETTCI